MATAGDGGAPAGARRSDPAAVGARGIRRQAEQRRERVRQWLVWLRPEGPPLAAAAAGAAAVQPPLLREWRLRGLPRLTLGGAADGRARFGGVPGPRPGRLARGRERRADHVQAGTLHADHALGEPADVPAGGPVLRSPKALIARKGWHSPRTIDSPVNELPRRHRA